MIIEITTDQTVELIEVAGAGPQGAIGPQGPQGPQGATGPTGPGVPDGGDTGQVLAKASNADQDTEWSSDYATAAQGSLADTAVQPGDDVSKLTNDANYIDASGAPVQSVNTKTGTVTLNAADVGADPAGSASGVQSNLTTHIEDDTNPHQVTATQVGLGNVDDTADLDKPISTATQSALDDKADKTTEVIAGTGLDGGGDLSEDRTINLDSATVASLGKAHDQNTDTKMAEGTADEVAAVDVRELLDGVGPQLFTNQSNHLSSLVAPIMFPGFGEIVNGQAPALLYGPPSAPLSGQVPQQIGDFRWCYNFNGTQAGLRPSFGLFGSGAHGDTQPIVVFMVDADNWYQVQVRRSDIRVFQSIDGTVTQLAGVFSGSARPDGYVNFFLWFARDRFDIARYDTCFFLDLPPMSFLLDEINFIGFEDGGGRGRFFHTVVYGQNLNSITSITP